MTHLIKSVRLNLWSVSYFSLSIVAALVCYNVDLLPFTVGFLVAGVAIPFSGEWVIPQKEVWEYKTIIGGEK